MVDLGYVGLLDVDFFFLDGNLLECGNFEEKYEIDGEDYV